MRPSHATTRHMAHRPQTCPNRSPILVFATVICGPHLLSLCQTQANVGGQLPVAHGLHLAYRALGGTPREGTSMAYNSQSLGPCHATPQPGTCPMPQCSSAAKTTEGTRGGGSHRFLTDKSALRLLGYQIGKKKWLLTATSQTGY